MEKIKKPEWLKGEVESFEDLAIEFINEYISNGHASEDDLFVVANLHEFLTQPSAKDLIEECFEGWARHPVYDNNFYLDKENDEYFWLIFTKETTPHLEILENKKLPKTEFNSLKSRSVLGIKEI